MTADHRVAELVCPWCFKNWEHFNLVMQHNLKGCPALTPPGLNREYRS
jgi:hypothetical protein